MQKRILVLLAVMTSVGIGSKVQAAVALGAVQPFAVLGGSAVTNTGLTSLNGNLGVYPATGITGFYGTTENDGPGTFTGVSYEGAGAQQAQADALTAYNTLAGLTSTQDLTGQNLGGLTLTPGVYKFDSSAQLTGNLTLNGAGTYVFQIGSTLTTASNASINFTNGANPFSDVFWQVGSSATLGISTQFGGTILANQSDTLTTGANVDGRVIALNGAVTLDSNNVAVPEPASLSLLALGGLALIRRRHTA